MKKLLVLSLASVISVVLLSGCRYTAIEYSPQPLTIADKEQAKAIILRVLSEQPRRNGAQNLTVYDDRVVFSEDRNNLITMGAMNSGMAIYYTTPDKIELYRHKSSETFNIILWKHKTKIYVVRCFTEPSAKKFIDAFKFMQDFNLAIQNNPTPAITPQPKV